MCNKWDSFLQPIYGIICLKLFLSLQIITVTFEIHLQLWSNSFNPNSHGVGHIGHAPLWRQIAKQNFNYTNFEKLGIPRKLSCKYFFSEGVPLKKSIYVCFLRQKTSNPKGRSDRPAPVRAWQYVFLYLECRALTALTENDLPYCAYRSRGKGGLRIVRKWAQPYYDFFMITSW
jgi:hypothetical protein